MIIIPGLTSTRKERMAAFLQDMQRLDITTIALFPTCLSRTERESLYRDLEAVPGLRIPHVHLRSDCEEGEIEYLAERFGTEAFNIHPRLSTHPFPGIPARFARSLYVENVDIPPEDEELRLVGGICPDFSHRENAELHGRRDYMASVDSALERHAIGCCHVSAVRVGVPNTWSGEWDHHAYGALADFDYLVKYRSFFPARWASLELENSLEEQLAAAAYIRSLLRN